MPKIEYQPKSASNPYGFLVQYPDTYQPGKLFPFIIFLHGVGGRGDGSAESWGLTALISRGELPIELQQEANRRGIIILAPQTPNSWNNGYVDACYNYAILNFGNPDKAMLAGISLGGGGVRQYITATRSNADLWTCAVICCGVKADYDWKNVADAKLSTWWFHAANDSTVSVNSTLDAVKLLRAAGGSPRVTIYNSGGHEIWHRVFSDAPPATTADAQNYNQPTESVYDWFLGDSQAAPAPIPPVSEPPVTTVPVAVLPPAVTVASLSVKLDASASTGVNWPKAGDAFAWKCEVVTPGGWKITTDPIGMYGGPIKTFTFEKDGVYKVTVTVKSADGVTASASTVVTVAQGSSSVPLPEPIPVPPAKTIIARLFVDGLEVIVYSDKTSEIK